MAARQRPHSQIGSETTLVVSPLAGLAADQLGYISALAAAATIFAASALVLVLSPFRQAPIG